MSVENYLKFSFIAVIHDELLFGIIQHKLLNVIPFEQIEPNNTNQMVTEGKTYITYENVIWDR